MCVTPTKRKAGADAHTRESARTRRARLDHSSPKPKDPFHAARQRTPTQPTPEHADATCKREPAHADPAADTAEASAAPVAAAVAGKAATAALSAAEAAELREFDLSMGYGPCVGLTRLERWHRARKLGLNPPVHVRDILEGIDQNSEGANSILAAYPL